VEEEKGENVKEKGRKGKEKVMWKDKKMQIGKN
jgi:hypothetical protein